MRRRCPEPLPVVLLELLLQARPARDDDANGKRPGSVERVKVRQVTIEERILVVPFHLDRYARKRTLLAQLEHVNLVAPDPGDELIVDRRRNVNVPLAPAAGMERTVEAHGHCGSIAARLVHVCGGVNAKSVKRGNEVIPVSWEGVAQYNVGVARYTVRVPVRPFTERYG